MNLLDEIHIDYKNHCCLIIKNICVDNITFSISENFTLGFRLWDLEIVCFMLQVV